MFLLQQVKLSAIICNKHGVYEMPHELRNYERLKILLENIRNISKLHKELV